MRLGHAAVAEGEFIYKYIAADGSTQPAALVDPPTEQCIALTADKPAFSPINQTSATATVFADADCGGDEFYVLKPLTGKGDETMKIRAVVFNG
ncbi:hypothetical protein ABZ667_43780 [Streptomyces lavendulae]|uniref:hypothetical protein n=1 Tax=Streptomyces lavendulae TaxID=1914 RepID=UPI0033DA7E46